MSRILTAKIYICVVGTDLKIMVHFYSQLLYWSTEIVNKRLWLRMARVEMDYDLKIEAELFELFPRVFKKSILTYTRVV